MGNSERISTYDSQSPEYHRAFDVFLANTDQKVKAREWLKNLVYKLPSRRVFVDAGAGNGQVTGWFLEDFERTVAIEPNRSLCEYLNVHCPAAEIHHEKILDSAITDTADLVLCSHVFYYIDQKEWITHLEKLVSWVDSGGVVVVVLQNHNTDCMKMLESFFGYRFNFYVLAENFARLYGKDYNIGIETVPALVTTVDINSALIVGEFMLNLLPISNPPARNELEDYIRRNFLVADNGFSFSCDQDFLTISN